MLRRACRQLPSASRRKHATRCYLRPRNRHTHDRHRPPTPKTTTNAPCAYTPNSATTTPAPASSTTSTDHSPPPTQPHNQLIAPALGSLTGRAGSSGSLLGPHSGQMLLLC